MSPFSFPDPKGPADPKGPVVGDAMLTTGDSPGMRMGRVAVFIFLGPLLWALFAQTIAPSLSVALHRMDLSPDAGTWVLVTWGSVHSAAVWALIFAKHLLWLPFWGFRRASGPRAAVILASSALISSAVVLLLLIVAWCLYCYNLSTSVIRTG
jgi:hypothetical protein